MMSLIEILLSVLSFVLIVHLGIGLIAYFDDIGKTHDPRNGERPEDMKFWWIFCWGFFLILEIIKFIIRSNLFKKLVQNIINIYSMIIKETLR